MCGTWVIRCFPFASTTQILLPQDAPGSEKYPVAEYVVRATDTGQDHEPTYAFFVGLGGEARLLGIEGLSDEIVDVQAASDQGGFSDSVSRNSTNSSLPSKCH